MSSELLRKYINLLNENDLRNDKIEPKNVLGWGVYVKPEPKNGTYFYVGNWRERQGDDKTSPIINKKVEFTTVEELAKWLALNDVQYDYSGFGPNPVLKDRLNTAFDAYLQSYKVRNQLGTDLMEGKCPECGGPIVSEDQLNEKQDACYHKVRSRYKVWPSAYASGALVQCRKKGAANWGKKKKKK